MSKRNKTSLKQALGDRSGGSVLSLTLRALAGGAAIAFAAWLVYFPALCGGFILDDDGLLTDNAQVQAPDGLYRFWFSTESHDYWPVANTTLWCEWRLWGISPTGYHVTNLLLHIVASWLIWITLRKLSFPGAFWAAMLFAVHPVNVESVAWIAQRKGLLAMVFFLLSILWYFKFESRPADAGRSPTAHCPHFYWLSLLAFVLAMLSKGSVAPLPFLLLGIIWWRQTGTVPIFAGTVRAPSRSDGRRWSMKMGLSPSVSRRDLIRIAPFFVVALALTAVNVWFQTHGAPIEYRSAGFIERLLGAGAAVWFYLYKALLPLDLAFVYPQWCIETNNVLWWLPLLSALAVTIVLWRYRTGWSRPLLFAWGFFCVALVPVLGFVDVGYMQFSLVTDHYQHIALIAVIALAAAGWSKWRQRTRGPARFSVNFGALAATCVLILLARQHSSLYSNAITLYQASLAKNPQCHMLQNNLGFVLNQADRPQEAIEHCSKALDLQPNYPDAHNNLAIALENTGRLPEAIDHYQQALLLKPDYPQAHYNLGGALAQTGRLPEAIEHFREALRLKPYFPEALNNLGLALANSGRAPEAIDYYQQALRLRPEFPEAQDNLALALCKAGRGVEAIVHFQQALRLRPDNAKIHNNLGLALADLGRLPEAIEQYNLALLLRPNYPEAHSNLGNALLKTGKTAEAIEHYRQAIHSNPNFPQAHFNLGTALLHTSRSQEAINHFQLFLRLKPDNVEAYFDLALAHASLQQSSQAMATAQKALELARSQGNTEMVGHIEAWLNTFRDGLSKPPNTPPAVESSSPSR